MTLSGQKSRSYFLTWNVKNGRSYDVRLMSFTLDDLERLKVKVTILWFEISWKRWHIRGWTPGKTFLKAAAGFRLAQSDLTLDEPWGQKPKSHFLMCNMCRTVRVTMLDPMNMTLGHIDSSSLSFCQQEALLLHRNRATRYVSWNIMAGFWLSYWQKALLMQRKHTSTLWVEIV